MAKVVNCGTVPDREREHPYLTAKDVARKYNVTNQTVYRWVARGLITPVRVGKTIRFDARRLMGVFGAGNDPAYS